MLPVDSSAVLGIIKQVAAREILPRFRNLGAHQIRTKSSPTDLVTEADEAAERALTAALAELLPDSTVVGEEAVAADPAILDRISGKAPVWIVDPVDGTSFFAHGDANFCVMVALAEQGKTQQGWIYEPVSGRSLYVARGKGVEIDGKKIGGRLPVQNLKDMHGIISTKFRDKDSPYHVNLTQASTYFASVDSPGCAGIDYIRFLLGQGDFILYRMLKPWDHAVGQLALAETGLYAARLNGAGYDIADIEGEGLLIALDQPSWLLLRETLFGQQ